jgi:hypothetical protein
MQKYFISFILLLSTAFTTAFGQTSQTLQISYTVEADITQLILDLGDGQVEIRNTTASRVSVETIVQVTNLSNPRMLAFLIEQGRYNLSTEKDNARGKMTISHNKTRNVLIVKGEQCQETLTYIVYVPSTIKTVENKNAAKPSAQALPMPK